MLRKCFALGVCVVVVLGLSHCVEPKVEPGGIMVIAPKQMDPGIQRLIEPLKAYLTKLTGYAPSVVQREPGTSLQVIDEASRARVGLVLVLEADSLASDLFKDKAFDTQDDHFYMLTKDEGAWANNLGDRGATFVYLSGATLLARQYAIYEFLRRLGARFYHPEQEFLPKNPLSILRERARTPTLVAHAKDGKASELYKPDYTERSYSFHGSHPLEHQESFSDARHPIKEAMNVNDWIVKNRGNRFRGAGRGVATGADRQKRVDQLNALRKTMGFPTGAGISLHNEQQGANAVVDRSSSTPPKQQIEDYVARQLKNNPAAQEFGIHFGPTEFTVTPDKETINWINWAGQKALSINPKLKVVVNVHITGTQPTPHFSDLGCPTGTNTDSRGDYYDLAFHVDKRFVAKVHTVMFYPLEGPAFVYNQKTFAHKLCLMKKASKQGRPLIYFPEGSWWLSFDNPIPVYLPLYILTRGRDIELLKDLLKSRGKGTLYGHRMFNSGHEWGYWQQDYAVGLWGWNVDISLKSVIDELNDPLCKPLDWKKGCAAKEETTKVMIELMNHQKEYLMLKKDWKGLAGGLYAYMAGEDPADEIAAVTGFEFRPVKVAYQTVARWGSKEIKAFQDSDLKALKEMEDAHKGWLARLDKVSKDVPEAGKPWFGEIVDGIENNMLRAQHTRLLYAAVIAYREAQLRNEAALKNDPNAKTEDPKAAAAELWKQAEDAIELAEVVIRRREKAYRYPGKQVYGGGDTPATAVKNGTTYPWRVHTKTHTLAYWKNRHTQVKDILDGKLSGSNTLTVSPTIDAPGVPLQLTWPKIEGLQARVDIAGKAVTPSDKSVDLGKDEGFFPISGRLLLGGREIQLSGGVARAKIRAKSPAKSFTLTEPQSPLAQSVLKSLFPPILWARVPGANGGLAFAPDLDEDGNAAFTDVVFAKIPKDEASFTTEPVDFLMPIPDPGSKEVTLSVRATKVVFSGEVKDGALQSPVKMSGNLVLEDLAQALIKLAGFDEKGAYQTLASVLKFDAKNPPKEKAFKGELKLETKAP